MLEKTLQSPLDCKEIKPVNPKGNHPWISFGKTDAEAPILWAHDAKNWLIGKDPDAGKNWGQEEKGLTEDEMVGCITNTVDMGLGELRELVMDREPGVLQFMGLQRIWQNWATEVNWTE